MKKLPATAGIILFLIITVGFFLFSRTEEFIFLQAKFQKCPYGHKSLKVASISYGMPEHDLTESIENIDENTIHGGCIIDDDSPHYSVVCSVCGYQRHVHDGHVEWFRDSNNAEGFEIPLKSIVSNFPILDAVPENERANATDYFYLQQIANDEVVREAFSYSSLQLPEFFNDIIINYAKENGIILKSIASREDVLQYEAKEKGILYEIEVSKTEINGTSRVEINWMIESLFHN